jgi:hypothetical protein
MCNHFLALDTHSSFAAAATTTENSSRCRVFCSSMYILTWFTWAFGLSSMTGKQNERDVPLRANFGRNCRMVDLLAPPWRDGMVGFQALEFSGCGV